MLYYKYKSKLQHISDKKVIQQFNSMITLLRYKIIYYDIVILGKLYEFMHCLKITKIWHQRTWTWYGSQVFLEFLIFLHPWDCPLPGMHHACLLIISLDFAKLISHSSFLFPWPFLSYITYNLFVHICSHMHVEARG